MTLHREERPPGPSSSGQTPTPTPRAQLLGGRYQLLNRLGHGGMGTVYRALDCLTGQVVTLKQLGVEAGETVNGTLTSAGSADLAEEFRLLAQLRHPNIVSVLDYGFDEQRRPFLTMDLEENADTIIEAGVHEPLAMQVDLLVQALRALVYLHQRDIIHRDIKPDNVVVVRGQVKVLDFGLSIRREIAEQGGAEWAGTPLYSAPELLGGEVPNPYSDLFSMGLVAHELFTGAHPFADLSPLEVQLELQRTALPRDGDAIDSRVRPVLARLLARDRGERYGDGKDVIADLAGAIGQPLTVETVATRESLIQTAPLVGRTDEMARLRWVLAETRNGRGGVWLVGGESGVGKTRLLDEVRTLALIDAIPVVRGQAMSHGGEPYEPWRDVLRYLVLQVEVSDAEAAVLKAIVPDISELLGRDVFDAPEIDATAGQTRLFVVVEEVVRRQPRPMLVLLEDLHWAGSESLRLLAWLRQPAESLPVLLLGSFRSDEATDVPAAIDGAHVLALERLQSGEITALGEAMIGSAARGAALQEFLQRETEGIPFFVVEVVRALAESAGDLARVTEAKLPTNIVSGGMQRVVRRRLSGLAPTSRAPLETAAVLGRTIDAPVMQALHPEVDFDRWLADCARSAVLELRDREWSFAHDKLREQVALDLGAERRRELHATVAEALEATYPEAPKHVTALAYHWHEAGDVTREAVYAERAGMRALAAGAATEALRHLGRALELQRASTQAKPGDDGSRPAGLLDVLRDRPRVLDPTSAAFRIATLEAGLTEACYRLGDLGACRAHGEEALRRFGPYYPTSRLGRQIATLQQLLLRVPRWLRGRRSVDEHEREIGATVARVQSRLTDTFFYSLESLPLVFSALRVVNQAEAVGSSPELARGSAILAILMSIAPRPRMADRWARRALEVATEAGRRDDLAWVLSRRGVMDEQACRWEDARAGLGRVMELADEVGDVRLREEARTQMGAVAIFTGDYEHGISMFDEARELSARSGNAQVLCWSTMGKADIFVRLGRAEEAIPVYVESLGRLDENAMKTEGIWGLGMLALARLRMGDEQGAYDTADESLFYMVETQPLAYWTQHGMAATAEVFVTLLERGWGLSRAAIATRARQACATLNRFARHLPLGLPHALLWEGSRQWQRGRERRAMRLWRKAVAAAEDLGTPYELGHAHLEIGRHMAPHAEGRRHHLEQAARVFGRHGCAPDLAAARAELKAAP